MSLPDFEWSLSFASGTVLLTGVVLYAVLGGADFGGGAWDLFASGPRKHEQRDAISRAIGPVWEANHVWLIFVIVVTFTAFPPVFAALSTALYIPFSLALLGIVFRGSGFVFRSYARQAPRAQAGWGRVFEIASVITPFLFGMCAGAVASGNIQIEDDRVTSSLWTPWLAVFPAVIGLLAVLICAFLAAVFMTLETKGELQSDFRLRALTSGAGFLAMSLIALIMSRFEARIFWDSMLDHGLIVVPFALGAILIAGFSLWRNQFRLGRVASAASVAILLAGWSIAQYPYMVVDDLTFEESASPDATLSVMLVVLAIGSVFLIPSLWLLFTIFKNPEAQPAATKPDPS